MYIHITCICVYICTNTYIYIYIYVYVYTYVAYMYMCICVCIYTCIHTYIYIYIYIEVCIGRWSFHVHFSHFYCTSRELSCSAFRLVQLLFFSATFGYIYIDICIYMYIYVCEQTRHEVADYRPPACDGVIWRVGNPRLPKVFREHPASTWIGTVISGYQVPHSSHWTRWRLRCCCAVQTHLLQGVLNWIFFPVSRPDCISAIRASGIKRWTPIAWTPLFYE